VERRNAWARDVLFLTTTGRPLHGTTCPLMFPFSSVTGHMVQSPLPCRPYSDSCSEPVSPLSTDRTISDSALKKHCLLSRCVDFWNFGKRLWQGFSFHMSPLGDVACIYRIGVTTTPNAPEKEGPHVVKYGSQLAFTSKPKPSCCSAIYYDGRLTATGQIVT
jgi:hypothetical protein